MKKFHLTYTSKYTGTVVTKVLYAKDRSHAIRLAYSMQGASRTAPISAVCIG